MDALELEMIQYRFWNFSILCKKAIPNSILQKIRIAATSSFLNESEEYISQYYPSHPLINTDTK